jgi:hypothetical protein
MAVIHSLTCGHGRVLQSSRWNLVFFTPLQVTLQASTHKPTPRALKHDNKGQIKTKKCILLSNNNINCSIQAFNCYPESKACCP